MLEQFAVQPIRVVALILGSLGRSLVIAIGRGLVLDRRDRLNGRSSLSLRSRHDLLRSRSLHGHIHINRGNFPQIVIMAIKHRAHS